MKCSNCGSEISENHECGKWDVVWYQRDRKRDGCKDHEDEPCCDCKYWNSACDGFCNFRKMYSSPLVGTGDCRHTDDVYTHNQRNELTCHWELNDSGKLKKVKEMLSYLKRKLEQESNDCGSVYDIEEILKVME